MFSYSKPLCALLFTAAITSQGLGDVVISLVETGGGVELTYSGTLNVAGLASTNFFGGNANGFSTATSNDVWLNSFAGPGLVLFSSPFSTAPNDFFTATTSTFADTFSGTHMFVGALGESNPLRLRDTDITNDVFTGSGTQTFNGATFASLGFTEDDSFLWKLDNEAANTITLTTATAVPEPSSALLLGLIWTAYAGRRRWNQACR